MRTIETTATVGADNTLTVRVPPDIPPGEHRVVLVIDENLPVLARREAKSPLKLNVLRWEAWPADSTFRREDLYGDKGR